MKSCKYLWLAAVAVMSAGMVSCNDDDPYFDEDNQSTPIKITQVYLEDAESVVPDRPVEFIRLGQTIRIEGSGFIGLKYIYINGHETYFNRTYVSDRSLVVSLSKNTPITDADPEVRNTIRLVKDGAECTYEITVRSATPTITSLSTTLPMPGEKVFAYGTGLQETTSVMLPGNVEVTEGIESDEEGEWFSFTMPSGLTESGSLLSTGANGQAKTPAYFNNTDCMILDFDGTGSLSAWEDNAVYEDDLVDDPAGTGRGKCAPVLPLRLFDDGGFIPASKSRASECWTNGSADDAFSNWARMAQFIDPETPTSEIAFQFELLIDGVWNTTGQIEICAINNYNLSGIGTDDDNAKCATAFFVPWIQDGEAVGATTDGKWMTVTIPLNQFGKYAAEDATFQTVLDDRAAAKYDNFGIGFANTDFTLDGLEVISSSFFGPAMYTDNWRIVPYETFTISDFPDEEEGEEGVEE